MTNRVVIVGGGTAALQSFQALSAMDGSAVAAEYERVRMRSAELMNRLPSHYEYFAHLRNLSRGHHL